MASQWPKIRKLLKALEVRGEIYVINRKMVYSDIRAKTSTVIELAVLTPIDEYFKAHPEKKRKKKDQRQFVREFVYSSFREIDVLLQLVDIYKGGDGT